MAISNIRKNSMGTTSFMAKFAGMRKEQDFIVYPKGADDTGSKVQIQSDTRIGMICLDTGRLVLSPPVSSGAYNHHLLLAKPCGEIPADELQRLKTQIADTASGRAGSRGVYVDNSGAAVLQS